MQWVPYLWQTLVIYSIHDASLICIRLNLFICVTIENLLKNKCNVLSLFLLLSRKSYQSVSCSISTWKSLHDVIKLRALGISRWSLQADFDVERFPEYNDCRYRTRVHRRKKRKRGWKRMMVKAMVRARRSRFLSRGNLRSTAHRGPQARTRKRS